MASTPRHHAAAIESRAEMNSDARVVFREQFYKTEMCRYYRGGCAKGDSCSYAHGKDQLRLPPDLLKTSLCRAWVNHSCPLRAQECPFAHGWSEMRATPAFVEYGARQSTRVRRRGHPRSFEEPVAEPTGEETPQDPVVPGEAEATDGAGRASPGPATPTAPEAGAEAMRGVAIAVPAFVLAPQVLVFRPTVVDMQQQALTQTLLPGLGEHFRVALPDALGQALADTLHQAMPDHYED